MFEHKREALIPTKAFIARLGAYLGISISIILGSLCLGTLGYHIFEGLPWIDSILNASMLLGGMGPVNTLHTISGKIFASIYALYSGIVFLVSVGVLIAPIFHRFLHRFHIENDK